MADAEKPIQVRYQMERDTWLTVVENSVEIMSVENETMDDFTIEYANQAEFDKALNRFHGLIDYVVID